MEESLIAINNTLNKLLNMLNEQEKGVLDLEETTKYAGIGKTRLLEIVNKENTDFPYFKNGRKILVNKSQLDLWLKKIAEEHRTI